ncbi:MAG: YlxR family protein [Humibacillus sp.]|nr:YlxR family protein [Humibacillus sp.]MDN5775510.1 YlxR family protein [Humibacillus sp.]
MGCRRSDSWSALLRVVAATEAVSPHPAGVVVLVPDPRHRMPGRGAWVHMVPECFEQASRRKAFGRALRLRSAVDLSAVAEHLGLAPSSEKHERHHPVRPQG